jgi:hypothetical protein
LYFTILAPERLKQSDVQHKSSPDFPGGRVIDGKDGLTGSRPTEAVELDARSIHARSTERLQMSREETSDFYLPSRAHPPAAKWWEVFRTIFKYDPNALVHGVLFPQWRYGRSITFLRPRSDTGRAAT